MGWWCTALVTITCPTLERRSGTLRLSPMAMQQIQPGLLGPGGPSASASAGPWAPRGVQAVAGAMPLRRTGGQCPMAVMLAVCMEAPQRGGPEVGQRPLATFIPTGERPRRLAAARQATTRGPAMPGRAEWERHTTP